MPKADAGMSRKAAIVGIGETDHRALYRAAREKAHGCPPVSAEGLALAAFEKALDDAGLERGDIDGLSVSLIYGGPTTDELAAQLGIDPAYRVTASGLMAGPLPMACAAIAEGRADTIAMVYAAASRSIGRQYGGKTYSGGEAGAATPTSYYYYHPWGWSSQAAHWALIAQRYLEVYGYDEADLGAVAVQLRANAAANPQAIMTTPMTRENYLASRPIVRPLRLFDMCLVNDGAVCLIVRRGDKARDCTKPAIDVAGWGESRARGSKLATLVCDRLAPQLRDAGAQALAMAGLDLAAIGHFEGYDPASIHLVNQIEGYGFLEAGEGLRAFREGKMAVGGSLPVNVAGGMMSGAYMHGWNLVTEAVRQLRHEAVGRQIAGLEASMVSVAQTDVAHPLILTRAA
ncbi:Acetyl-CoA acetyltransferase-like protein [Novosphingobium resinovorum]|nr:Acetyl-CoA acetyltransferase-like protein [Novosphingobium resinovorum]